MMRWVIVGIFVVVVWGAALLVALDIGAQPAVEEPTEYDGRLIELERIAVERAFRRQIEQLFGTWMKDERDQPKRALSGARQARSAYIRTMKGIDARAEQLKQRGKQ